MKDKSVELTRASYIISKATNPCVLSLLFLILMAVTESASTRLLTSWIITLLLFLIVLPLAYVYLRTYKTGTGIKLKSDPTIFLKQHPSDILIVGLLFGIPGLVGLFLFEAPLVILQTYAALLIGSFVIAICNIFYRVSYHLGAVTILVMMAPIAWGQNFLVLMAVIPLVSWAKYQIDEHTIIQLLSGFIIAIFVGGVVLIAY